MADRNLALMTKFRKFLRMQETEKGKDEKGPRREEEGKSSRQLDEAKSSRRLEDDRRSNHEKKPPVVEERKPVVQPKRKPMKLVVEKAKKIEDEEAEEFEAVQGARPAVCVGKRKVKLKWKSEDSDRPSGKESHADELDGSGSAESPPSPTLIESSVDVERQPLKEALAELTLEKRKLKDTVERLRLRVKRRDKKIEKLQNELKAKKEGSGSSSENHSSPATTPLTQIKQDLETAKNQLAKQTQETEKNKADMQRLLSEAKKKTTGKKKEDEEETDLRGDSATAAVALRILAIIKRNQLLEKAIPSKENAILHQYFTSGNGGKLTTEVLTLLDKAIGAGMNILITRPQDLDDPIDNQIRELLKDSKKAKSILLEVMLSNPSYIPFAWGGGTRAIPSQGNKKQQEEQKSNAMKHNGSIYFMHSGKQ